jgi:RNA polymerase sigma factor (sigma-70 family)
LRKIPESPATRKYYIRIPKFASDIRNPKFDIRNTQCPCNVLENAASYTTQADQNLEAVYTDKHYNLVVECKQGSKKACYELYRLYSKAMLNVAFRIVGNIAEAEDVLQESFLDAFNKVADFRQDTTFGLWLKQIVINRSINLLRKRKMELVDLEDGAIEQIADEEPEDEGDVQYRAAQVKEAIKELPEGYRLVISLYLLEGYDHEEIGQVLNISENTSRTQFLRAKRKLIEILNKKRITS